MHIDDLSMPYKYYVRLPWKIFFVESISITQTMNNGSNDHFRSRITASNTRHVKAATFG